MPKLEFLDLRSNFLNKIPEYILTMTTLTYFNFADNELTTYPQFSGMTKLQDILIGENMVTSLSCKTFEGMTDLQMIDISYEEVALIPPCFFRGMHSS